MDVGLLAYCCECAVDESGLEDAALALTAEVDPEVGSGTPEEGLLPMTPDLILETVAASSNEVSPGLTFRSFAEAEPKLVLFASLT